MKKQIIFYIYNYYDEIKDLYLLIIKKIQLNKTDVSKRI